jgi:hypothetical protein
VDALQNPEQVGAKIASSLVPVGELVGDDEVDTTLLGAMAEEARRYVTAFAWSRGVAESYFAGGVGGILAVFFFHIRNGRPDIDPWIWVIVGDIPPAYLPVSDCKSPADVFRTYVQGMSDWVVLARQGKTGTVEQGIPPVDVPATAEWAEKLDKRLQGLKLAVSPFFEDASSEIN